MEMEYVDVYFNIGFTILGATITFFITWFWHWRIEKKRTEVIWNATKIGLISNYQYGKSLLDIIEKENERLEKEDIFYLSAYSLFQTDFIKDIVLNFPKDLRKNNIFSDLRTINFSFVFANDLIKQLDKYKGPISTTNSNENTIKLNNMLVKEVSFFVKELEKHGDILLEVKFKK